MNLDLEVARKCFKLLLERFPTTGSLIAMYCGLEEKHNNHDVVIAVCLLLALYICRHFINTFQHALQLTYGFTIVNTSIHATMIVCTMRNIEMLLMMYTNMLSQQLVSLLMQTKFGKNIMII